ncbi:hypothetical protein [Staphylococcus hominis]|uniref:hypothetical protein n=1 Tax=Staphylococcus hominis TaxID=1290 RepID=UPI001F573D59|nr:hypothetical protein [Staphylococcus hominis]MCI2931369.1 hypothetical protein [Staphylococcus hominis]
MVKLKRKIEMNLYELINWAWDNDIRDKRYESIKGLDTVYFDQSGGVQLYESISSEDVFIIETEEEITEETLLPKILILYDGMLPEILINVRIENIDLNKEDTVYLMEGDTNLTLVWKKGDLVK